MQWKNTLGHNGKLIKHSQSLCHLMAADNETFRQQEGFILNLLTIVSKAQKTENRDCLSDLLDCCYFLFKNELLRTRLRSIATNGWSS